MFAIIGIVIVFGAVIGGFLMEKGQMAVLVQPAELLIIAGAGIGTLLVANPMRIIKAIVAALTGILKGSTYTKDRYLSTLKMMYQFLNKVREGMNALAADERTGVLLLVSKPPAKEVMEKIISAAKEIRKPIVGVFLGSPPKLLEGSNICQALTLEEAALLSAALSKGEDVSVVTGD